MNRAKRYLLQYSRQVERVRQLEDTIDAITAAIESITLDADGMPRGSDISDRTARLAVRLANASTDCEIMIARAWAVREDIERVINSVPDAAQSRLLYDRYILLKSWDQIADAIGFDPTYTRGRLHEKALASAEVFLPEEA